MRFRTSLLAILCSIAAIAASPLTVATESGGITVFAAASLTDVLKGIGEDFTKQTGVSVRFSLAASSQLARQVESGAPADVFISADQDWMNYLQERKLIAAGTRRDIVTNTLVLVAPLDSKISLKIGPGFALAEALGAQGRIAMGDPSGVPAGKYGKAALSKLGVWNAVEKKTAPADNVRSALNFVARGEAVLGIVYGTDAKAEPRVKVIDTFPAQSHERISYPAAATATAGPNGARFVHFLSGPAAATRFAAAGFGKP